MKSNEILPNEIRDRLYSSWYSSDEKDELIPKILEALQIAESEIEEKDIIKTSMSKKIDEFRKEIAELKDQFTVIKNISNGWKTLYENEQKKISDLKIEYSQYLVERDKTLESLTTDNEILQQQLKDCQEAAIKGNISKSIASENMDKITNKFC